MKIGELAQKTGLAPSQIRFHESMGLLKTVNVKPMVIAAILSRAK
ncbi:MerR family transcriptional regulator [Shewanella chilikensis]|jgi:DNA-binding transcriptional MerR regulator